MSGAPSKRLAAFREAHATFGSRTDVGCVRDHNEDSLIVKPPLFVVADGMGGHAAGEVASEIAVQVMAEHAPARPDADELSCAVEKANLAIIEAAREGIGREGMGTTLTAAMLEGERLVIAQVGDSRAYLFHQGKLQQITRDHSLMADMIEAGQLTPEEARYHPNRSVITRALGSCPGTKPDIYELNVEAGDRLLLCSDGLTGMVFDEDIEGILARTRDPQRCAALLVNEAIAAGGHDNVTVIVADVTGDTEVRRRKMARKTKVNIFVVVALLVALFAGSAFGFNYWIDHSAYLAEDNGKVAIYSGVPDTLFGVSFSTLVSVSDVNVDDLAPNTASRLREKGITTDGVEAAENLIQEYREDIERSKSASKKDDSGASKKASDEHAADAQHDAGADANAAKPEEAA